MCKGWKLEVEMGVWQVEGGGWRVGDGWWRPANNGCRVVVRGQWVESLAGV